MNDSACNVNDNVCSMNDSACKVNDNVCSMNDDACGMNDNTCSPVDLYRTDCIICFIVLHLQAGASPLPDNDPRDKYLYEITLFTGSRKGAGKGVIPVLVLS